MKYDPSKYCHNLKKIGEDFTSTIPVTSLTWELEGGNDPMSKKRRGEFSDFHGTVKKIRKIQKGQSSTESPRTSWVMQSNVPPQQRAVQQRPHEPIIFAKSHPVLDSDAQKHKNIFCQTSNLETVKKMSNISDGDTDSEDELRMMIAKEEQLQRTSWSSINENDSFEVVRNDFKSEVCEPRSLSSPCVNNVSCSVSDNIMGNDCEYDSGDTDEIIAMKNISKVKNTAEFYHAEKPLSKKPFQKKELSNHCNKVQRRENNKESALSHGVKPLSHKSLTGSSSSDNEESEEDEEYETTMKNCPRINLTLGDLEQLVGSIPEAPEDTESSDPQTTTSCRIFKSSKSPKTPRGKRCVCPEEILASLLEEENNDSKQKPEEDKKKPKFKAFKGIGCLYGKELLKKTLNIASRNISEEQCSLKRGDSSNVIVVNGLPQTNGSPGKLTTWQHTKKTNGTNYIQPQRQFICKTQGHKVISSNSGKGSESLISSLLPLKGKKSLGFDSKSHNIGIDRDSFHGTQQREVESDSSSLTSHGEPPKHSPSENTQESTADFSLSVRNSLSLDAQAKPAEDNQKRLAALEARQRAKEVQKKLVHNALANLDGPPQNKPTHIIFGSDSESEMEETATQEQNLPGVELIKESGKLFDSDKDQDSDSENDSDRFKIKPQFEGRAGQKLMDLQLHFGSDDRFRMDSRFLESDNEEEQEEVNEKKTVEEEELATEKKKALSVIQSVLNIDLNKGPVAAKKFKDIVHYDPTRHDHITYERPKDDRPKESKAKRKKKREEAEKLPEVSKDTYYDIATDLKEIFQATKDTSEKEEDAPQHKACGGEEVDEVHNATALMSEAKQSSGFMFSFFDSDPKDIKEETYKIETVKPRKIAWQGDPQFQDSSSEEEEEVTEETDHRKPILAEASLLEKETTRFFFFSKNDERLHGSDLFWSGVSNISKSSWEAQTKSLLMDCRKKHKEARRKVKQK